MGAVGLAAAVVAANQNSTERWLLVWLAAATVALGIGVTAMLRKALRLGAPLAGAVGRRFAMSLASARRRRRAHLERVDDSRSRADARRGLLLYGTGVLAGGVFSLTAVRLLGMIGSISAGTTSGQQTGRYQILPGPDAGTVQIRSCPSMFGRGLTGFGRGLTGR